MIIVGSKDIGPTKYLIEYTKNLNEVYWIKTNKNKELIEDFNKINNYKKKNPKLILTGSCIGSGLDKKLIEYGKKKKIKTASFIEHWSLLRERFLLKKKKFLKPNYLFVIDDYVKNFYIKNLNFKSKNIFVVGSKYLEKLKKQKIKNKNNNFKNVLFISQPHKKLQKKLYKLFHIKDYFGFSEYDVIQNIIENIDFNSLNLTIKLHPNERSNKFELLKKRKVKKIINISKAKIVEKYDLIIGMDSMLLLELHMMGAKVLSIRPNSKNLFYGNKLNIFPIVKKINNKHQLNEIYYKYKSKKVNFKKKEIKDIIRIL